VIEPGLSSPPATVENVGHANGDDRASASFADETLLPGQVDAASAAAGFTQRVKALATTAPLHDLDARKSAVQTADYSVCQMAELALHAIDLVTIAMDFDTGAQPEQVLTDLTVCVGAQATDRPQTEHERVARWVLENLLNVAG
jgi:hypothetical protein